MEETNQSHQASLQTLQEIRQLMERSSRFISLSGLSGIAAGACALVGAYLASQALGCWNRGDCMFIQLHGPGGRELRKQLFQIGAGTFVAAFGLAFLFTWLRSKQNGVPLWGPLARRLMWAVAFPLIAGGLFLYRMIELNQFELVAPGCLVFYGLALVNASKYTFKEVRYLGYFEILLGLINTRIESQGLLFWAIGFGVLHIIYGAIMWWKYERTKNH